MPRALKSSRKARLEQSFSGFRKDATGVTTVEFALVAVPFFFILMAIIEVGMMLTAEHGLQEGVQRSARMLRTGAITTSGQFAQEVCEAATLLTNCAVSLTVNVQSAPDFASLPATTFGVATFLPGGPSQAVVATASFDWNFTAPLLQPLANIAGANARRIVGVAIFRNEPP